MLKAFKYRLYPTEEQKVLLSKSFGCVRFVWNWALNKKTKAYATEQTKISCFDMILELPEMKAQNEWLKEVYSQSLQAALRNLDASFTNFFRKTKHGSKEAGYPKFKSKNKRQSIQFPQNAKADFENEISVLPKLGNIKTVFDRRFNGRVKTVTVSMETTGKLYISFLVEDGQSAPELEPIDPSKTVGIDLGLKHFIILSNGEKVNNQRFFKRDLKQIKKLSKRVSRKTKGGNNQDRARQRLALAYERSRNRRKDFLHKLSTKLIRENQTICMEDLNIVDMMQKVSYSRSIGDASWNEFVSMIQYKAKWNGKHFLQIGRFDPSTKMCHKCGYLKQDMTKKIRSWTCPECSTEHDRDINAAKNIRNFALLKQNLIGKVPTDCRELTLGEIAQ
jgi:putative transposase